MNVFRNPDSTIAQCDVAMAELNGKIKRAEQAYESLRRFRASLSQSQNGFREANLQKKQLLPVLDTALDDNPIAKKYQSGMNAALTDIGINVVGNSFESLSDKVGLKMAEYQNIIGQYTIQLGTWNVAKAQALAEAELKEGN